MSDSCRVFPGNGCCEAPEVEYVGHLGGYTQGKAGDCCRPVFLFCVRCKVDAFAKCNSTRQSRCRPCAGRHRARVQMVVQHGLYRAGDRQSVLLTITAPGDRQHCKRHRKCSGDRFGCEVCPCTPEGGVDLAEFNATMVSRLNRVFQAIRRGEASPQVRSKPSLEGGRWVVRTRRQKIPLEYFCGREVQDGKRRRDGRGRNALHVHVPMFRSDGKPLQLRKDLLRALLIRHGFGHEVDLKPIAQGTDDCLERVGRYVSKYVSKSADARESVPWRGSDGTLSQRASYRAWSASRGWPQTMAGVKAQLKASVLSAGAGAEAPQAPSTAPPLDVFMSSYTRLSEIDLDGTPLEVLKVFLTEPRLAPTPSRWRKRQPGENQMSFPGMLAVN